MIMKKTRKVKKVGAPVKNPEDVKKNRCVRVSDHDIKYIKIVLNKKSLQEFIDDSIFSEKLMEGELYDHE
jgi:hypothetical protein